MTKLRGAMSVALCAAALIGACSGGRGPTPTPTASPTASPPSSDPCGAAGLETFDAEPLPPTLADLLKHEDPYGADNRDVLDAVWNHRTRGATDRPAAADATAAAPDVGDLSIINDDGRILLRANAFDLRGAGLRFSRNGQGGFDVSRVPPVFRTPLGRALTLEDDDTSRVDLGFTFPFYGGSHSAVFVNSDGNLSFDQGDVSTEERGFGRLLSGPARIAPFFADLDPSTGGRVLVNASSSGFTASWCGVRGFESTRTITVQATLLPDGGVELAFGDAITLQDGIVAVSPGATGVFAPVDLSAASNAAGGTGAVGERFSESRELDEVALARAFYATHPDIYDQLVVWADAAVLTTGTFAFERTIANEIRGLGTNVFDASRDYGSGGRLRSIVMMDRLSKYPDDPASRVLRGDSTLSILGHESGHRWLALLRFRGPGGQSSDALLGRQLAHWSFFFDSDASFMEGNDIEDLTGGSFRTIGIVERYSLLDQYAMGLVGEGDVPPFFYVEAPTNASVTVDAESAPRLGVTFNGTRRVVLINDVVAAVGARQPSSAQSTRLWRQAFIYFVSDSGGPSVADTDKLERIRRAWGPFFETATDGRMRVETRLAPPS